jgi:branched-chain amino acid transport system substrate-binding protein
MIPRSLRVAGGAASLLLMAGCAGNATTSSSGSGSTGPIVVGASMALSGQINLASTLAGYQMKINEINKAGGLDVGGAKRKIQLKVLDNRGDTSTMLQQVRTLVLNDGASALLGSCCQENIDMEAQADALKVPLVEVDLPVELLPPGKGYTWDAFQSLADAAHQFYQIAGTVSTNKKTLIVTDNDAQGISTAKLWTQLGKQAGFTAASTKAVPTGTTDFSNVIASGKSSGAQILIASMTPPDCFAMWKQMKALAYTPKLAIGLQCAQTPGWGSLGSLGNGTLVVLNWTKTAGLPYTARIIKEYGAKFPSLTDLASVAGGYHAADILLAAIKQAGSDHPQAINKAMGTVRITSALGLNSFKKNKSITPTYLGQWENGGIAQVWPTKGAVPLKPLSGLK